MGAMAHLRSRRTALLIATTTGLATAASFGLFGGVPEAAADCGSGAVVIVAGTNDPYAVHLQGAKKRYEDQGYVYVNTEYPTTLWPLGATGYDQSTRLGYESAAREIASYQAQCGDKPVVVVGYSQGARIAGDVLADIGNHKKFDVNGTPDDPDDDVEINPDSIYGELYSDPRRAGDRTGRGIELSLIGVIPGLTMTGPRGSSSTDPGFGDVSSRVVSVCIEGDAICDLPDPLYDPIGAIDGIVGYFTKHFLYPVEMGKSPFDVDYAWDDRATSCVDGVCMLSAKSGFAELVQGWATSVGYTGDIPDFLENRPRIGLPSAITLSGLQPIVRLIQGFAPQLPQLGYGAYLPDLFVFDDILQGIITLTPARFVRGVKALAASVRSMVLAPVNFVTYWAGALVGPTAGSTSAMLTTVSDDTVVSPASARAFTRVVAEIDALTGDEAGEPEPGATGSDSTGSEEKSAGGGTGGSDAVVATGAPSEPVVVDSPPTDTGAGSPTPAGGDTGTAVDPDPVVTRTDTDTSVSEAPEAIGSGDGGPDSEPSGGGAPGSGTDGDSGSDSSGDTGSDSSGDTGTGSGVGAGSDSGAGESSE
ncbi:cutinase family protein [Gordonia aurantiaca]|uniref:cutinase family protein n=1 Tax=Gordonia sp. B21 TaxID=3151852 RepID=UPI0032671FD0